MHRPGGGDRASRAGRGPLPRPRRSPRRPTGAACEAMREALDALPVSGTLVIGRDDEGHALAEGVELGARRPPARPRLRPGRERHGGRRAASGALSILAASDPGGLMQVPRMYMRRWRSGRSRRAASTCAAGAREPRGDRRRVRAPGRRRHRDRARPAAPRRPGRRDPRGRRPHQADRRRRHHGLDQRRDPRHERPPRRSASAARPRASSPRRRCAAWAARSRASCGR